MAAIPWSRFTVKWRASLKEGAWAELENVEVPEFTIGLAPTIDQATLHYRFGTIDGTYREALDLKGMYVRIDIETPVYDGAELVMDGDDVAYDTYLGWVGYVLTEQRPRWPQETVGFSQRLRGGDQTFTAYGLEWFLAQETVNHSIIHGGARIDRVIGFNTGFGEGRDIEYAERGNKDTRSENYAADKDHCELWTADEIVGYLLTNHQPKDKDGVNEPATYALDLGTLEYLQPFSPSVPCEGNSVWQILNSIISHSRGLTWKTVYDDDLNVVSLILSSMATQNYTLPGGGTLPEASEMITLDDLQGITEHPIVGRDISRKVDQVICRGARRRSVFTVSFANDTLTESWLPAEQVAYNLANDDPDPIINDTIRLQNRFERVYTCFHVPTDWNGEVAEDIKACPAFVQGSDSVVGAEKLHLASLRLLPTLPLKVGYDYTDATAPVARDPTNIRSEFMHPFAIIGIGGGGGWRFAHKMNLNAETGDDRLTSYHLHILSGTPGMQLVPSGSMPHALALGSFDPDGSPEEDAVSNFSPEVDYHDVQVTVCGEWCAYCEGYWPVVLPASKPLRRIYVTVSEDRARLDWLAEETVLDVDNEAIKKCTTAGAIRDDRPYCQNVARFAYEWYAQERATLQINYDRIGQLPNLGALITTIGTGAAQEEVNAVVSQISMNLERGTATLIAGFAELDFAEL